MKADYTVAPFVHLRNVRGVEICGLALGGAKSQTSSRPQRDFGAGGALWRGINARRPPPSPPEIRPAHLPVFLFPPNFILTLFSPFSVTMNVSGLGAPRGSMMLTLSTESYGFHLP